MLHNTVAPRRVVCGLNQKHPTGEATRAAAAGDQENHSRSNISSNALPSRFELALVPTFTDERDAADGRCGEGCPHTSNSGRKPKTTREAFEMVKAALRLTEEEGIRLLRIWSQMKPRRNYLPAGMFDMGLFALLVVLLTLVTFFALLVKCYRASALPVGRHAESVASSTPAWKTAMNLLKFKLPLRTVREVLEAEAHLYDPEQRSVLFNVLKYLLEENMRAASGRQRNHRPGSILSNALLSRFDLAPLTVFKYQRDPSNGLVPCFAGKAWEILKPLTVPYEDIGASDVVYYRPNLNEICRYLTSVYCKALQDYARRLAGEPEPMEEPQPDQFAIEMRNAAKDMNQFCRFSRHILILARLTESDLCQSGMTANTMTQSLMDDLKLFADAMLKLLGDDYFLFTKSSTYVRNAASAILVGGDWRAAAARILEEDE